MSTKQVSTKRADKQSVRQREKFPVRWASGGTRFIVSLLAVFLLFSTAKAEDYFALSTGVTGAVNAIVFDNSGNLYAGGDFTQAGGITVNRVAKWNGSNWSSLGTGINSSVTSLAVDKNSNLYAGGWFTQAGGIATNYVAKWNGTAWSALGTGMPAYVNALVVDSAGNLYAGGGNSTTGFVAKWNGSTWTTIGNTNVRVYSLAFDNSGNLYAGGSFLQMGGNTVSYIAKWNGSTWSAVGNGINNQVTTLKTDKNGTLYAGGAFTQASGTAASYVAKWDGSAWRALDTGMNNRVTSLTVSSGNVLYAGGQFTQASGQTVNYLTKWDGSAWKAISSGTNIGASASVYALAFNGQDHLYLGGNFVQAGGQTVSKIALVKTALPSLAKLDVTKTGSGTITSTPAGISCDTDCTEDYALNTQVTLTATVATGSTFLGWGGACSGTSSCQVTMSQAQNVTANFNVIPQVQLSVTKTGNGTVSSTPTGINCGTDCNESYSSFTTVSLNATPSTDNVFKGWTGGCSGSNATVSVTMDATKSCTAVFEASVTQPPAAVYERFAGTVVDQDGKPLAGATVKVNGVEKQTGSDGSFEVYAPRTNRYVVNAVKSEYALASQIENNLYGNANLRLTVKKADVIEITNPAIENTIVDSRDTEIVLPANALVDANGNKPTGAVKLLMYTYDLANEPMPGDMGGINSSGQSVYLESAGAFFAEFTDDSGKKYNLAPGQKATISVPAINNESTVDLWSYDEAKGTWIEEGSASLVDGRFQGEVSHFSAWNFDWGKSSPACVELKIEQPFFDAYKNGDTLQLKVDVVTPTVAPFSQINSLPVGTHVLYNLPQDATVKIYVPPSTNPYIVNAGTAWSETGETGAPPTVNGEYPQCKGKITLTSVKIEDGWACIYGKGEGKTFSWQLTDADGSNSKSGMADTTLGDDSITLARKFATQVLGIYSLNENCFNLGTKKLYVGATSADCPVNEMGCQFNPTIKLLSKLQMSSAIRGVLWNDLNSNGLQDSNEAYLQGWTVFMKSSSGVETSKVTDANGYYEFANLSATGNYTISVETRTGATYTTPQSVVRNVDLVNIPKMVNFAIKDATKFNLTVNKVGSGTVTSTPAGINCGTDCTESFTSANTPVTLTATSATGFKFVNWSGACSGTNATTTVMMNAEKSCTANFTSTTSTIVMLKPTIYPAKVCKDQPFDVTFGVDTTRQIGEMQAWLNVSPTNLMTANSGVSLMQGGQVLTQFITLGTVAVFRALRPLTLSPPAINVPVGNNLGLFKINLTANSAGIVNFSFSSQFGLQGTWSKDIVFEKDAEYYYVDRPDPLTQTNLELQLTVEDCTPKMTLTVAKAGTGTGTVTSDPVGIACGDDCVEDYPADKVITLTATANSGSMFTGWSGGVCSGTSTCTVTMSQAKSVTATFNPAALLTIAKMGKGKGTVVSIPTGITCGTDCTENYALNTSVQLAASALPGSVFAGWGGNCSSYGTTSPVTLTMNVAKSCTATFNVNPCAFPTIKSKASGNWSDTTGAVWQRLNGSGALKPSLGDVVSIESSNMVYLNSDILGYIKGLCVKQGGTLELQGSSGTTDTSIYTSESIHNYGTIRGANGKLGLSSTYPYSYPPTPTAGISVSLTTEYFLNAANALIYAGNGGIHYGISPTVNLKGGKGGSINILAGFDTDGEIINYGKIGATPYNANYIGGKGGNAQFYSPKGLTKVAQGGDGGSITLQAGRIINASTGYLSLGYGGSAQHPSNIALAKAGKAGNMNILPFISYNGSGMIYGGGNGNIWIEPEILLAGGDMEIVDAENITIYGGDDSTLSLNGLREGAIVAKQNLTFAVGKNGVVDLTGNVAKALQAGNLLQINADTVRLGDNVQIEDIAQAPVIDMQAAKIIYHVTLTAIGSDGAPNTTVPVELNVTNGSPTSDTYTLAITDTAGWPVSGLPNTLTVEGLQSAKVEVNVTLPATPGQENTLTVTAVSQTDTSVKAEATTTLKVIDPNAPTSEETTPELTEEELQQMIMGYKASGTLKDKTDKPLANVSIQVGDNTTTTDATGTWQIDSLIDGNYTVTATKDGYTIAPQDFTVKGGDVTLTLEAVPVGDRTAHGTLRDDQGKPIAGVTLEIDGKTATTDALGNWEINGLVDETTYTVTARKDGYTFAPTTVDIGNETLMTEVTIAPLTTLKLTAKPSTWKAISQGQELAYTFTITNGGQQTATAITLTEQLPKGATLVSMTAAEGTCDLSKLICTLPDLAPGSNTTVSLTFKASEGGNLKNVATLNSAEYPVDVQTSWKMVKPYLSVTITDSPDPVQMLKNLHYTLNVELSPVAPVPTATGIKVVTQLPKGVELQQLSTDQGSCRSDQHSTITCELDELSVASPEKTSQARVEMDLQLKDAGLLMLTMESKISSNEYPSSTTRERSSIFVPPDFKVDMAIVIDTTGSMQGEINGLFNAAKKFLQPQVSSEETPTIALIDFKDDVKVLALSKDHDVILNAIKGMKAEGGGLCPEASAEAIEIALNHVKEGGSILLATDASPYDDADVESLLSRLQAQKIRFNAIISGDCTDKKSWN